MNQSIKHIFLGLAILTLAAGEICAQESTSQSTTTSQGTTAPKPTPSVVHPKIGTSVTSSDGKLKIKLIGKKQNFTSAMPRDVDINSPKSVNVHPNGKKYYVNSLEGCATVSYSMETGEKLAVIRHKFNRSHAGLWAPMSGLFRFTHYTQNLNTFSGKPVESTFSHNGRYLWVPYYRRSYDLNAQDPSAVAVIDTQSDTIIRLFETGPLPKMITTSHDNRYVAISHWGNNTVGILDVSSNNYRDWHYVDKFVVDRELQLNFSLTESVDRDVNSGYCLRGTVFTPDDKYLLIGCMGGGGGIAVIDVRAKKYLGRVTGMMSNVRHLVIRNGWLYLSINKGGYIQRIRLEDFLNAATNMQSKTVKLDGWENCKVGAGARTIEFSPDGRYIYAACNSVSKLCVVEVSSYKMVAQIDVDSYPVGLDVSADGRYVFVTSQGRSGSGGNAVNIYEVTYH